MTDEVRPILLMDEVWSMADVVWPMLLMDG